jgi:hypothetical protein
MIPAKEIDGELWIKASDHHQAIKEALAQPAQEPVAWMEMVVANLVREGVNKHNARELAEHFYTAPSAAHRPEAKLKEKNT